jgi:hypothetical protein
MRRPSAQITKRPRALSEAGYQQQRQQQQQQQAQQRLLCSPIDKIYR